MEITSKGFKKPAENEYYSIEDANHNAQLTNDLFVGVDSAIGQKADTASVNAALALKANTNEVLLLSGGNIVGNLNIGDTANSALRILKVDDGLYSISAWKKNNPANDFLELRLDGSISGDWSFKNAFCVRNAGNGALYKVYHEGNVTVSTSAPSSTLTNGCIHHVY